MQQEFKSLNRSRKGDYKKNEQAESFLEEFNQYLLEKELNEYSAFPIHFPFLFVIGAPRSGTTLLSQLIANSFDISYINNLSARFFLAPLHGIRFSEAVLGKSRESDFRSNYARTTKLSDIHEYGYFWRHWLNKHTFDDISRAKEKENEIDWEGVLKVLSSLQHETQRPFVFKNIYGSYHMRKFTEMLGKVIFIYVERDELDSAVSILNARKKYNTDLNVWWSYQPLEYEKIKDLDYWSQIAGQIYFLRKFYLEEMERLPAKNQIRFTYREMCEDPLTVITKIKKVCQLHDGFNIRIINRPPQSFPFRKYEDSTREKQIFKERLEDFRRPV